MKLIIFTLFFFVNTQSNSSEISNALQLLSKEYKKSIELIDKINDIESKYNVVCKGDTYTKFPDITKKITFKANCKNELNIIKVKIKSSFYISEGQYFFKILNTNIFIKNRTLN